MGRGVGEDEVKVDHAIYSTEASEYGEEEA